MIVALLGKENSEGDFEVIDVAYAEISQPPLPQVHEDKYIAIVSGLHAGDHQNFGLKAQLLMDYLTGELGSDMVCS
jgi:DNA polymerase delta subunit 2